MESQHQLRLNLLTEQSIDRNSDLKSPETNYPAAGKKRTEKEDTQG